MSITLLQDADNIGIAKPGHRKKLLLEVERLLEKEQKIQEEVNQALALVALASEDDSETLIGEPTTAEIAVQTEEDVGARLEAEAKAAAEAEAAATAEAEAKAAELAAKVEAEEKAAAAARLSEQRHKELCEMVRASLEAATLAATSVQASKASVGEVKANQEKLFTELQQLEEDLCGRFTDIIRAEHEEREPVSPTRLS